jgi:hypothetical protein
MQPVAQGSHFAEGRSLLYTASLPPTIGVAPISETRPARQSSEHEPETHTCSTFDLPRPASHPEPIGQVSGGFARHLNCSGESR